MPEAVELLPPDEAAHGNERWYELRRAGITASEIAIILGISPYGSPFSLYWQKANDWRWDGNDLTSAGRHLEDAIAEWWQATHGFGEVACPAGLYAHPDRPWQLATPDRLLCDPQGHDNPFPDDPSYEYDHSTDATTLALLECKWVAYSWDGWGEEGTDEIPVYYRAQVLWQLDTLGVDEVHIAALGPGGFRAYVVRRNEAVETDLEVMRGAGLDFHRRLVEGDPPDLDGHSATISTLQRLHPSVGEGDVEVSVELAEAYRQARADRKDAEARVDECEAQIRAALGSTYSRAVVGKKLVASRSIYDQSGDSAELTAIEDDWPVVDRLNPGRSTSYA